MPCEIHKQSIINTIITGLDEKLFQTENSKTASDEIDDENDAEIDFLEQLDSPFTTWLDDIVKSADETVSYDDDGNRDNVMYNPTFANDFIRLCKILPLWSGISCDPFGIDEVTSSSSNVESDFKNIKQSLANIIPCSVDIFVQEHIELLRGASIEASQQHNYVKFIGRKNVDFEKSNEEDENSELKDVSEDERNVSIENIQCSPDLSGILIPTLFECRNGGEPGGAHRCIRCKKTVHILPCCSVSIGDEEGYGERRLCNECATNEPESSATNSIS